MKRKLNREEEEIVVLLRHVCVYCEIFRKEVVEGIFILPAERLIFSIEDVLKEVRELLPQVGVVAPLTEAAAVAEVQKEVKGVSPYLWLLGAADREENVKKK